MKVKADLRVSTLVSCGMHQVFLICLRREKTEKEKKKIETGRSWWREEIYDCHTSRYVKLCSLRPDCYNLGT